MGAMDYCRTGEIDRCVVALRSLLRDRIIDPKLESEVYSNLGTALAMLKRSAEAEEAYIASLKVRPNSVHTRYNLGIMHAEAGRLAEAESVYRATVAIGPRHASAYNNLGNLLVDVDREAEAADVYRRAIVADPTHAMAYNNLANIVRKERDAASLRAAGRLYLSAIRLDPGYSDAYKNVGNLLKEVDEWRVGAVRAYYTAVKLRPTSTEKQLFGNLGDTLSWLGHRRAANLSFELAVRRGAWAHPQQRPVHYVRGLRARPWWNVGDLPVVRRLTTPAAIQTLRDEGRALLARSHRPAVAPGGGGGDGGDGDRDELEKGRATARAAREAGGFMPYKSPALESGAWSDVTLMTSGSRQPGWRLAPRSFELYASLGEDALSMVSGSAYFSTLSPGARLRPHCGPTNIRLRVHIGLDVPDGASIRVGNETRVWIEGGAIIFDDSFEHEVSSGSALSRLVFIFDVWHPDLKTHEQRLAALADEPLGLQRYRDVVAQLRAGRLPRDEEDLIADRRERVIF